MPMDPNALAAWIDEHGPYLYHATADRDSRERILAEGIRPGSEIDEGRYDTGEGAEHWLTPRRDHAYLGTLALLASSQTGIDIGSDVLVRVDLRLLDPASLNPDEDGLVARCAGIDATAWGLPCPRLTVRDPAERDEARLDSGDRRYASYGQWAEAVDLGNDPALTDLVLRRWGALAVRGGVPAEACSAVRIAEHEYEDEQEQPEVLDLPAVSLGSRRAHEDALAA